MRDTRVALDGGNVRDSRNAMDGGNVRDTDLSCRSNIRTRPSIVLRDGLVAF